MRLNPRFLAPVLALVAFAAPAAVPAANAAHLPAPTVVHLPNDSFTPGPGAGVTLTAVSASAFGVLNTFADGQQYQLAGIAGTFDLQRISEQGGGALVNRGEIAVPSVMPPAGPYELRSLNSGATTPVTVVVLAV